MSAVPINISALSRQSGWSRATVRQRLRNGWHPEDLLTVKVVEIRKDCHGVARVAGVATHPSAPPVDLAALRRDIKEWARLHGLVERLKERRRQTERRGRFSDPVSRFVCLAIGVGFFVLIALSATMGVQ